METPQDVALAVTAALFVIMVTLLVGRYQPVIQQWLEQAEDQLHWRGPRDDQGL